jgi:hypothetical protein
MYALNSAIKGQISNMSEDNKNIYIQNLWPESANELYRQSDHLLSVKLVPTFADRGCHAVSVTNPYGRILDFLDQKHSHGKIIKKLIG